MTIKKFTFFMLLLIYPNLCLTSEFNGEWAGIEVMGCDVNTAQSIRKMIPLQIGQPFKVDDLNSWCGNIKKNLPNKMLRCSFIAYQDGKFYFNVDILPDNQTEFRNIPTLKSSPKIPTNLVALLKEWQELTMEMFKSRIYFNETFENGYLDSNQPKLHELALKLSRATFPHNKLLLKIIKESNDPSERAKAATLLSWSGHPNNIEFVMKHNLLNDPDSGVRNDLARSLYFTVGMIKNETLLKKAIDVYCHQAKLPTHCDRNKALISLKGILENHKYLSESVNKECRATLEYISQMSILPNVGEVAKDILVQLENTGSDRLLSSKLNDEANQD